MQGRFGYVLSEPAVILGKGRHCVVKLASSTRYQTPRKVAIKINSPSPSSAREAEILFLLNHENVVEILDYFVFQDYSYIVLALAENGDLRTFVRHRGRLGEDLAQKMCQQIFEGVAYLHNTASVAHCDLKCENVLVDAREDVKIADFGLAVEIGPDGASKPGRTPCSTHYCNNHNGVLDSSSSSTNCLSCTPQGIASLGGSPAYAAPEVLDTRVTDLRAADVWSAGVITFLIFTTYLPFGCYGNKNIREAMDRTLRWPRPLKLVKQCSRNFVQSVLMLEPSKRPTARVLLERLQGMQSLTS
nr:testis-specific serine/threonine-protein kinase 2-like [Lytechinus pictus]